MALKARSKKMKSSSNKNGSVFTYILFGIFFGYFLSKARATDYDTVLNMFLFKDFQLYGVIMIAIVTVFLGLMYLKEIGRPTRLGTSLNWKEITFEPKRLVGALLFGAGWAIAGTCPGTSLTQLGEGKLVALFTVTGIFLGVWAYSRLAPPKAADEEVC